MTDRYGHKVEIKKTIHETTNAETIHKLSSEILPNTITELKTYLDFLADKLVGFHELPAANAKDVEPTLAGSGFLVVVKDNLKEDVKLAVVARDLVKLLADEFNYSAETTTPGGSGGGGQRS